MTVKDYRRIGEILARNNVEPKIIHDLCDILAIDNPFFIKAQLIEYMYSRGWTEMSWLKKQEFEIQNQQF